MHNLSLYVYIYICADGGGGLLVFQDWCSTKHYVYGVYTKLTTQVILTAHLVSILIRLGPFMNSSLGSTQPL